jgi:uncharacterized protein (TIRG00374 family)
MMNDNRHSTSQNASSDGGPSHGKWVKLIFRLAVTIGLVWFVFNRIDVDTFLRYLINVDITAFIVAVAIFQLQAIIGGLRWGAVLKAVGIPFRYARTITLFFIGYFFGQALPSSVGGDAIRIYEFHKDGHSLTESVTGVLLERVFSVIILIILVLAMQPLFVAKIGAAQMDGGLTVVFLFSIVFIFSLAAILFVDRIPLPDLRIVRSFRQIAKSLRQLATSVRSLSIVGGLALAGHVNTALGVYVFAYGLGIEVSFLDCLMLMPPVVLITTVPISIAGWGVREIAMITAFGMIGISSDPILALSIMVGLANLLIGLSGGVLWLAGRRCDLPGRT